MGGFLDSKPGIGNTLPRGCAKHYLGYTSKDHIGRAREQYGQYSSTRSFVEPLGVTHERMGRPTEYYVR